MRRQALVCGVTGHRWQTAADSFAPYPVLQCRRCGARNMLTSDTTLDGGLRRQNGTLESVMERAGDRWQPKSRRRRPPMSL